VRAPCSVRTEAGATAVLLEEAVVIRLFERTGTTWSRTPAFEMIRRVNAFTVAMPTPSLAISGDNKVQTVKHDPF
jgi:hypothetical protein